MLVLASMDRVVDAMENHDDHVAHLFWSPDGKQLGERYAIIHILVKIQFRGEVLGHVFMIATF